MIASSVSGGDFRIDSLLSNFEPSTRTFDLKFSLFRDARKLIASSVSGGDFRIDSRLSNFEPSTRTFDVKFSLFRDTSLVDRVVCIRR